MTHEKNAHDHIDAAKDEIKSAAGAVVDGAKEKAHEVVADLAKSVEDAAHKVEHHGDKDQPLAK
jgi:vacuolar-type H+-ATPase subunit H